MTAHTALGALGRLSRGTAFSPAAGKRRTDFYSNTTTVHLAHYHATVQYYLLKVAFSVGLHNNNNNNKHATHENEGISEADYDNILHQPVHTLLDHLTGALPRNYRKPKKKKH